MGYEADKEGGTETISVNLLPLVRWLWRWVWRKNR